LQITQNDYPACRRFLRGSFEGDFGADPGWVTHCYANKGKHGGKRKYVKRKA
jgi:hypothetical protein